MKIKVSEATPIQLNWLVSKIVGIKWEQGDLDAGEYGLGFKPSTDWSQAGPIIEREIARLEDLGDEGWEACGYGFTATGPTPLIAAMRCYVASKLGDEVDVPDELLGGTNPDTN